MALLGRGQGTGRLGADRRRRCDRPHLPAGNPRLLQSRKDVWGRRTWAPTNPRLRGEAGKRNRSSRTPRPIRGLGGGTLSQHRQMQWGRRGPLHDLRARTVILYAGRAEAEYPPGAGDRRTRGKAQIAAGAIEGARGRADPRRRAARAAGCRARRARRRNGRAAILPSALRSWRDRRASATLSFCDRRRRGAGRASVIGARRCGAVARRDDVAASPRRAACCWNSSTAPSRSSPATLITAIEVALRHTLIAMAVMAGVSLSISTFSPELPRFV
jgi:hypothetical protein